MTNATAETPRGLQTIPLAAITPNPNNPRKTIEPGPLKELAQSIREHGVRQPVLVRPNGGAGKYELVVGERRWRASKLAGKSDIPAIVDPEINDRQALEIMILENLQRQDVHPLDEANGYAALMAIADPGAPKPTVEDIAAKVGKSVSYVYQRLKLSELDPAGQKDFRSGFITAAHAVDIARLQPEDQKRALEYCHRRDYGNRPSTAPPFRDLRQWIQENVQLNLDKAPFDIKDPKLVPAAGACTECPKRTGSNPALFEGMGKNTCTDPACFQSKKLALVNIHVDAIEAKAGVKPVLISHHYQDDGGKKTKGILYEGSYKSTVYSGGANRPVKPDSCKDTRLAVYVDSSEGFGDRKKAGEQIYVCLARGSCKVHKDNYGSSSVRDGAVARRNSRISKHYTAELFKALVAAGGVKKISRADREMVAFEIFDHLGHYALTPMVQVLEWDQKLAGFGGKAAMQKKIAAMNDRELDRWTVFFCLAREFSFMSSMSHVTRPELMEQVAKRHGVKAEKLLAVSKAKFAPKKAKAEPKAKIKTKAKPRQKAKAA